jgi:hypothetical protein
MRPKKGRGPDKSRNKYTAAASAAGYLFQCRYALLAALEFVSRDTGLEISIERFDDVSFEANGQPLELIQTKHHVSHAGNLSSTSSDFWKTLRNWSDAIAHDPSLLRRVRFVLVTTANAPAGSIAFSLRPGEMRNEHKAYALAFEIASNNKSATNATFYAAFLKLTDAARAALIQSIIVLDGAADLGGTREQIAEVFRLTVPRNKISKFVERLEGWWWGRICSALTRPEDSRISIVEVESRIDELRESFRRDALPVDLADVEPSAEEAAAYDQRVFVRQLKLVAIDGRRVELAKRDFYRAFEQRSRWMREQLLLDNEVLNFERRLHEEWESRYEAMKQSLGSRSEERQLRREGQRLVEWVEQDARFPLRSVIERFLTVGSYHILADRLRVGWHRDYRDKLQRSESRSHDKR